MGLTKGDIVLVEFPFIDLSQTKLRPAVILTLNSAIDEFTVCFISSQNVDRLNPTEFALLDSDLEFAQTGLRISSKVRVTRITTISRQLITKRLGKLGTQNLRQLDETLIQAFQLTP
ncbi:type II toxin-antitoxin system PemK/MazF family toxin [Leptolyngbya sp. AN03gr2]|uniref:type II toxin-antitoxin system PemK/MazF family toxin n=1 Tax=unclassified Leptolyngbya TaxID=2650499 RepID=UPI003D31DAD6